MPKKWIKLVNNERVNPKVTSSKECDTTSTDICYIKDNAICDTYAYDVCNKDFASCFDGADDYCGYNKDTESCNGVGVIDRE